MNKTRPDRAYYYSFSPPTPESDLLKAGIWTQHENPSTGTPLHVLELNIRNGTPLIVQQATGLTAVSHAELLALLAPDE